MKIAELLRQVADAVDQQENPGRPDPRLQNPAELEPIQVGLAVDTPCNSDAGADDELMVPPLQLKMELLKRAVDVDNIYDAGEPRADQAHENQSDELAALRRNAGIPMAAVMELSNDELLDD
jgi:hypothetical protein